MKLTFFLVIAILGLFKGTEGRFAKFSLNSNGKLLNQEIAAKLNSKFEDDINQKWRKHTKAAEEDDTVFYSDKFKSNIRGKKMYTLFEERTIYAYQGFRFAVAERFLPPEDQGRYWEGLILNATHIGPKCPQGAYVGSEPGGDEDCLFLNIYTPYKPGSEEAKNLTVMFFIYGGGFTFGDASTYMPTKLLNHDVILVTIHYRLGAFGFYTRDSPNAPGNLAFYDMISALRWVNRYISDFGGNPDLVTIFGESAGSVSVNYMMLLTKNENGINGTNLFRGAIAESGSALDHWAFDEDATYATKYFESVIGCDTYDTEDEILDCMRRAPFQDLVKAGHALSRQDRRMGLLGFRGCSPTLQTFNDTGLSFRKILYQEPRDYLINGDFRDVPFMTGSNREEGSLVVAAMYYDYLLPNGLVNNPSYLRNEMLRDMLLSIGVKDEPQSIAKSLQKRYCGNVDLADLEVSQYCLTDICGIFLLKAGSWQMCDYHSYYSKYETFYYSFEFDSDDSMGNWVISSNSPFYHGITHADELQYIFAMPAIMDDYPGQKTVYERMTLLWTNFARYLDPTPYEDTKWVDLDIPKWTPYKFGDPHFMLMNTEFKVLEDYADRWTITNDQMGPQELQETQESQESQEPEKCEGLCSDYEEQKNAFEITLIVFLVSFVIISIVVTFIFFRVRS